MGMDMDALLEQWVAGQYARASMQPDYMALINKLGVHVDYISHRLSSIESRLHAIETKGEEA